MNIRDILVSAGLVAVFAGVALSARSQRDEPGVARIATPQPAVSRPAVDAPPVRTTPVPAPARVVATTADERNANDERASFQVRITDFFATAQALDAATRMRAAAELDREVQAQARASTLSAGEAMLLRAELIRLSVDDELLEAERLTELTESYRADAERRSAAWATRDDPQLRGYHTREQQIVAEVMAMTTIPGGLTRDEYLRQRLQHERELAFR